MQNNCLSNIEELFLQQWTYFYQELIAKQWSKLDILTYCRKLTDTAGNVLQKMQALYDFFEDPMGKQVVTAFLNDYDHRTLSSENLTIQFNKYFHNEIQNIVAPMPQLKSPEQLAALIDTLQKKQVYQLTFVCDDPKLASHAKSFTEAFVYLHEIVRELYFLSVHKISFYNYGINEVSYTYPESELLEQLNEISISRMVPRTVLKDPLTDQEISTMVSFVGMPEILEPILSFVNETRSAGHQYLDLNPDKELMGVLEKFKIQEIDMSMGNKLAIFERLNQAACHFHDLQSIGVLSGTAFKPVDDRLKAEIEHYQKIHAALIISN